MLSGRYLASKPISHIDNIYYLFINFCIYSIHLTISVINTATNYYYSVYSLQIIIMYSDNLINMMRMMNGGECHCLRFVVCKHEYL